MKLKQKLSILLMAVMVFAFALTPATVYADTYSSPEYEWVQALEPLTPEDGVRIESWYWTGDDVVVDAYNQIYIDAKKVDVEATIQKYLGSSEIKFMPTDIAVYIWNSAGRTYKAETLALLKKVDIPVKAVLGRSAVSVIDFAGLQVGDIIRLDAKLDRETGAWKYGSCIGNRIGTAE